jgi:hypothetical protein
MLMRDMNNVNLKINICIGGHDALKKEKISERY